MGLRLVELAEGEWYHCYTRTIDRKESFLDRGDYDRFTEGLYLANSKHTINRSSFKKFLHEKIFTIERSGPLVAIGAYALMPNHFHLLLRQEVPDGISQFMQRLGTSYCMYFNAKYERIGSLFVGPFRARHIDTDTYLQKVVSYIHLNPLDIVMPNWKRCAPSQLKKVSERLVSFPYSSLLDYTQSASRPESVLIEKGLVSPIIPTDTKHLEALLASTAAYLDETLF